LSKRLLELEQSCAREQGRSVPLIVPAFGPDDVGADGTMEGNEIAWIEKTIAAHRRSGNGSIMYFVYNLKHPRIVEKLLEAYTSVGPKDYGRKKKGSTFSFFREFACKS
jgi:hypothetical protein